MEKSMDDPSTSEEIEVNPDFEELLEAFNEMHFKFAFQLFV